MPHTTSQPQQYELIHESLHDALREVVQALGGTKNVGSMMRTDRSADELGRWVADCLNQERREKFDPDQVAWLLREGRNIGCHSAMNYLARATGYAVTPIEPQDEKAELQRQFIEATRLLGKMATRIEQIG